MMGNVRIGGVVVSDTSQNLPHLKAEEEIEHTHLTLTWSHYSEMQSATRGCS